MFPANLNYENVEHIIVPKILYDKMKKVCEEKKDITIMFYVRLSDGMYNINTNYSLNKLYVQDEEVISTAKLMEASANMAKADFQARVEERETNLEYIRSHWWYKLFFSYDKYYNWTIKQKEKKALSITT